MLHIIYYRILSFIKVKSDVFWVLLFPILLGTCFYAAFGGVYDAEMKFESVPVAAVLEEDSPLKMVLDTLGETPMEEGAEPMLDVTYTDGEEAQRLLDAEKVEGVIVEGEELSLCVLENGMNASFLQSVLDEYVQTMDIIERAEAVSVSDVLGIISAALEDVDYIESKSISDGELNPYNEYFYALIAMACLFASLLGLTCTIQMKADLSPLGMRKCLIPIHHMKLIAGDLLGTYIIQCLSNVLLICYLQFVLGIDFGNNLLLVMLTAFAGSLIGLSLGTFVGAVPRLGEGYKVGITLIISMVSCFFSGLMMGDMRWIIEKHVPLLNRINPAALICDALYSLSIYDTLERYAMNMGMLLIMSVVLCAGSFLLVRRESYDQL